MRIRSTLVASAALLAGCSIPERDNPFDPSLAPSAKLRVTDTTRPDGTCGTSLVISTSDRVVLSASRGIECLALDARQTADPQGDTLEYRYELIDEDGNALEEVPGSTALAFLPATLRQGHDPGVPLRFRVTVTDPGGARSRAETLFTLANQAPVARTIPSRSLPVGGHPWSLGEPFVISFDASRSTDPDGDTDLQYCWTFPAELAPLDPGCAARTSRVCSPAAGDPCFTRTVSSAAPGRFTAKLEVYDHPVPSRAARSFVQPSVVSIGAPVVYVAPGIDFGNYQRVDVLRRQYAFAGIGQAPTYLSALDRVISRDGMTLSVVQWPDGGQVGSAPFSASNDTFFAATPDGAAFWAAVYGTSGGVALQPWTLSGDTPIPGPAVPQPTPGLVFDLPHLAVDESSNAWFTTTSASEIRVVSQQGSVLEQIPIEGSRIVTGLAARPGTAEVWSVQTADWISSASSETTLLVRHTLGDHQVFDVGPAPISSLTWADGDRLWALSAEQGLLLLDAAQIAATSDLVLSTLAQFPLGFFAFSPSIVDPASGDFWIADVIGNRMLYATTAGLFRSFDFGVEEPPRPLFVDNDGAIVVFGGSVQRGDGVAVDGTSYTLPIIGRFNAAIDQRIGGMWVPSFFPAALLHVAEDGTILEFLSEVQYAGDPFPSAFPAVEFFRVHPGSATAWAFTLDLTTFQPIGAFLVDLEQRPPVATQVLEADFLFSLLSNGTNDVLFEASGPGISRFAWIGLEGPGSPGNGIPGQILTMTSAGASSLVPRFDIPANEFNATSGRVEIEAALSPKSSSLCFATFEYDGGSTRIARLRRITPVGAVELLDTIPLPANASISGVGASADSARDLCWIAIFDQAPAVEDRYTRFDAYASPGSIFRSFTETFAGAPQSFRAPTSTMLVVSFQSTGDEPARRVLFEDPTGTDVRREAFTGERARFIGADAGGR